MDTQPNAWRGVPICRKFSWAPCLKDMDVCTIHTSGRENLPVPPSLWVDSPGRKRASICRHVQSTHRYWPGTPWLDLRRQTPVACVRISLIEELRTLLVHGGPATTDIATLDGHHRAPDIMPDGSQPCQSHSPKTLASQPA